MSLVEIGKPTDVGDRCCAADEPFAERKATIAGNQYNKYETKNPVARWLVNGFLASVRRALDRAQPESILDVGCADGKLASLIVGERQAAGYLGLDISAAQIGLAQASHPQLRFVQGSAYGLPAGDGSVDLALALEILEHLDRPEEAVTELARVTRRWALVSVPWEPIWRVLNLARGAYVAQLGNTPGHLQHFSRSAIRKLMQREFRIVQEFRPLPWTMLLLEKR